MGEVLKSSGSLKCDLAVDFSSDFWDSYIYEKCLAAGTD